QPRPTGCRLLRKGICSSEALRSPDAGLARVRRSRRFLACRPSGRFSPRTSTEEEAIMAIRPFAVGEALVGEGNEVAHIDLIIGPKDGPAGQAFANALAGQRAGHTACLAVIEPNLVAKPDTIMFNKVTIKGAKQAVQM